MKKCFECFSKKFLHRLEAELVKFNYHLIMFRSLAQSMLQGGKSFPSHDSLIGFGSFKFIVIHGAGKKLLGMHDACHHLNLIRKVFASI
jgi:hypothetical protein